MDLQWRLARKRGWIELGRREGLTFVEVAKRAKVTARTVRRWNEEFREEERAKSLDVSEPPEEEVVVQEVGTPCPPAAAPPSPGVEFAEIVESTVSVAGQIQIDLMGGGRVVMSGPFDVDTVARVIKAVQ